MRLTDERFWDNVYSQFYFEDQKDHDIARFLEKYLQRQKNKKAIELGSFPGSFIPTIGRKGYRMSGIDFNAKNQTDLPEWLRKLGIQTDVFLSGDLFSFKEENKQKFDLVCSFGLIEHFENYEHLIKLHADLLNPDGLLIITTPNFKGWMQFLPHRLFDYNNLKKHYLPSMRPKKWMELLENEGFDVQFSGYFGGYRFWVNDRTKRNPVEFLFLRLIERTISQLRKIFKFINFESSAFSAYCGIIAKKHPSSH